MTDEAKMPDECREAFEEYAEELGMCLDQRWGSQEQNPYEVNDTRLAFNIWKMAWNTRAATPADKATDSGDDYSDKCIGEMRCQKNGTPTPCDDCSQPHPPAVPQDRAEALAANFFYGVIGNPKNSDDAKGMEAHGLNRDECAGWNKCINYLMSRRAALTPPANADLAAVRDAVSEIADSYVGAPIDTEACNAYAMQVQHNQQTASQILAILDRMMGI